MKSYFNGARLGFMLNEEETEQVAVLMDYFDRTPHDFMGHCLESMWILMEQREAQNDG